tara:strand:- start:76 stop:480 length:405 start_codon:yes stop_codon:yes gene_type:complete
LNIDLDTTEGRKKYLSDKLDDLLEGINESYGTVLMEELLNRLELTIKDFNDEMKVLCDQLVKKQEERQHLLEILKANEGIHSQIVSGDASTLDENALLGIVHSETPKNVEDLSSKESEEDIPAWEKKLAKLEKK